MIFWVGLNQKRPRISGEGVRGGVDPVSSNIPSYYIGIIPFPYTAVLYGFCIIPSTTTTTPELLTSCYNHY